MSNWLRKSLHTLRFKTKITLGVTLMLVVCGLALIGIALRMTDHILYRGASLALDETVTQVWNEWRAAEPVRRQAMVALQAPGVQVEFDTEHLRRVLINLLDNALRFMGSQPDSLQLHTHAAGTGLVSLQVWSDGAPLDPSVERHLFEPFFSSHSRSSGLGLYICRELCQRHGASLTYQRLSRATALGPTGGNAFTVTFRKTTRPAEPAGLFDTLLV